MGKKLYRVYTDGMEGEYTEGYVKLTAEQLKEIKDTPEEWVCPECGFDDCYLYKNSKDFGLIYCPECKKLVKLLNK